MHRRPDAMRRDVTPQNCQLTEVRGLKNDKGTTNRGPVIFQEQHRERHWLPHLRGGHCSADLGVNFRLKQSVHPRHCVLRESRPSYSLEDHIEETSWRSRKFGSSPRGISHSLFDRMTSHDVISFKLWHSLGNGLGM